MDKFTDILIDTKVLLTLVVAAFVLLFTYVIKRTKNENEGPEVKEKKHPKPAKKKEVPTKSKKKAVEIKWSKSKSSFSHPWLLSSLKGHTSTVLDMDFSKNGRYLVSCSTEGYTEPSSTGSSASDSSDSSKENSRPSSTEPIVKLSRRQKKNLRNSPGKKKNRAEPDHERQPMLQQFMKCKMSPSQVYNALLLELLPFEQLYSLGFPEKVDATTTRVYSAFRRGFRPPRLGCYERSCARCGRGFLTTKDAYLTVAKCHYHSGKSSGRGYNQVWSCCGANRDSEPCQAAPLHVWSGLDAEEEFLEGFVETQPKRVRRPHENGIYALDCEMCYTIKGLELCKVTVISVNGSIVYNEYVKPEAAVVDYNTVFSGITKELIDRASKTLKDVQRDLLSFIHEKTILIGHGLENDLRALKIVHQYVVDTSLSFRHEKGLPFRYSLRHLAAVYLQRDEFPHDSYVDAAVSMELILFKLNSASFQRNVFCPDLRLCFVPAIMTRSPVRLMPVRAVV